MLPKWHILLGAIFSLLIWLFFPSIGSLGAVLIFLSSFLIDIDHYIHYVATRKDWSLKDSYNWHKNLPKPHKPMFQFLHMIEPLLLLGILSFFFNYLIFVLIGFLFHSILDILEMYYHDTLISREFFLFRYINRQ